MIESLTPRWSLNGKKALVTGGTRGIGAAVAEEFLALGAEVLVVARTADDVQSRLKEWTQRGWNVHGCTGDLAETATRESVADRVNTLWGRLDVLVNNVGTNIRKKTLDYGEDEVEFLLRTNLMSVFDMCRRAYPLLSRALPDRSLKGGSHRQALPISTHDRSPEEVSRYIRPYGPSAFPEDHPSCFSVS